MARPRVADGRDGLQIWRVAENILNKQSRTADKGWSCSLGVGRGVVISHRKKTILLNVTQDLGINQWLALVNTVMNLRSP
jgi:hypothetical protein